MSAAGPTCGRACSAPFYVWRKGFRQLFWKAFAFNIIYAVIFVGVWFGHLDPASADQVPGADPAGA